MEEVVEMLSDLEGQAMMLKKKYMMRMKKDSPENGAFIAIAMDFKKLEDLAHKGWKTLKKIQESAG